MSTHSLYQEKNVFYYCTVTCYRWINLFEITDFYNKIYDWFDLLYKNGCWISGYVIMPNHFHVIIYMSEKSNSLNKLFANGKRFMAYEIVSRLKEMNKNNLLNFLEISVSKNEIKKNKIHQVFMPSFDARLCTSMEMVEQKLDYTHENPVKGKWNLANSIVDYPHSSARWYEEGIKIPFRWFKDYREIIDESESHEVDSDE